jgi:hypothetical protein
MKAQNSTRFGQSEQTDEDLSCARCGGVVLCESWCESVNACVRYAHDAVLHPTHLSLGDRIILHALGVRWTPERNRTKTPEDRPGASALRRNSWRERAGAAETPFRLRPRLRRAAA